MNEDEVTDHDQWTLFSIFIISILFIVGSGCIGNEISGSYECPLVPQGYSEHVDENWIESPNITNIQDINDSVWTNLSRDTRYWLDNHSRYGYNVTPFAELTHEQQSAFLELKNNLVYVSSDNEGKFRALLPYFDPFENGLIFYDNSLFSCHTEDVGGV